MNIHHSIILFAAIVMPCTVFADEIASAALAEVTSKRTKTFDVAGARLKGPTKFEIRYPESWGMSEFAKAGLVARIASSNGEGIDSLIIVVSRGDPKINDPTPDKVFTPDFLSKFKLTGSTINRKDRLKEEAFDGAVFEYLLEQSKPPMKVRTYVTNYIFTQNGALVQLQFYVLLSEKANKEADDARIAAFRPVWKAILSTLKLK